MNPFRLLRRVARAIKHLPDRRAHAARRKRALESLTRSAPPASVLFLCHGNICRSPYAAAAARHLTRFNGQPIGFESAGFTGPDRSPPAEALRVARNRGVDLSDHRSQLVTNALLDGAAWIFVMSTTQRQAIIAQRPSVRRRLFILGDLDPRRIDTREIVDPWNQPLEVFTKSYDRIDRCLAELVRIAWRP